MPRSNLYWDTTVFLCFLNDGEHQRRHICEDILQHAQKGEARIFTSTFTIAEVVRPRRVSIPNARQLTPSEIAAIDGMFRWPWVEKIPLDQHVAFRAVQLVRDFGLATADAIHAASALRKTVDVLQAWDRDFSAVGSLISISEPLRLGVQIPLIPPPPIGPKPSDFKPRP